MHNVFQFILYLRANVQVNHGIWETYTPQTMLLFSDKYALN
jgi:hypothetical protein